jgi:hypothetical protein
MTAAHKSLPFGSKVKVTNKKSGDAVTVTITDRGRHDETHGGVPPQMTPLPSKMND